MFEFAELLHQFPHELVGNTQIPNSLVNLSWKVHETVPDGSVFHPHHFTYAAIATLLVALRHWDDEPDKEPIGVVFGVTMSLFGWFFMWSEFARRPEAGATVVLLGLTVALISLTVRSVWRGVYPTSSRLAAFTTLLIASDDVLNHAFGVATPLDWLWTAYFVDAVPYAVALILLVVGVYGLYVTGQTDD